jgi:ferritin
LLDEKTLQECADWIAEQLSEELGGFIAAELIDFVIADEARVREEFSDPEMDHRSMAERLMPRLEAEGIPVKEGAVTQGLVEEILHWEDECRAMAGSPRNVRH